MIPPSRSLLPALALVLALPLASCGEAPTPIPTTPSPGGGSPAKTADAGPTKAADAGPTAPPIVLFLVDTLRADRLSTYGGERPTSPELDAFAEGAVVFDEAYAPAPWTLPSTASLLTGRHPLAHGAGLHGAQRNLGKDHPANLRADVTTLAERLAYRGYRCEAFVANPYLQFGLQRGFEVHELIQTEGSEIVNRALERLDVDDPRPPFLLVHLMDCHDPLLVPDEYVLSVRAEGEQLRAPNVFMRSFQAVKPVPEVVEQRWRLYDAAVRYVDAQFGRLLDGLEERGIDDAVIVFTSDHGEEIYDSLALAFEAEYTRPAGPHGLGHGHTLFREVVRVPLVIDAPGVDGRRVDATARLEDVAPTLLALADEPFGVSQVAGAPMDGRSLVPWLRGGSLPPAPAFTAGIAYGGDRRGVVTEEWNFVRGGEGEGDVLLRRELGGLGATNLAAENAEVVAELEALLAAAAALENAPGDAGAMTPAQRARLEAVGYLDPEQESEAPEAPEAGGDDSP